MYQICVTLADGSHKAHLIDDEAEAQRLWFDLTIDDNVVKAVLYKGERKVFRGEPIVAYGLMRIASRPTDTKAAAHPA